jgi:hypothetical protein
LLAGFNLARCNKRQATMGWLWAARLNIKNVIPANFSIARNGHLTPIKKRGGI